MKRGILSSGSEGSKVIFILQISALILSVLFTTIGRVNTNWEGFGWSLLGFFFILLIVLFSLFGLIFSLIFIIKKVREKWVITLLISSILFLLLVIGFFLIG